MVLLKKYLSELRYFWKFFIPAFLVLAVSVLFSVYYGSHVLRKFSDIDLAADIERRITLTNELLFDQLAALETNVRALEKNDSIASATLYAFDDIIQAPSFLEEQLQKFIDATDVDVAIVAARSGGTVLASKKPFILAADEVLQQRTSRILTHHRKYYLSAKGRITSFGEDTAAVYLLQQIDDAMVSRFSQLAGVPLIIQNSAGIIAVTERLRGIRAVPCEMSVSSRHELEWNDTPYHIVCNPLLIADQEHAISLIQLYDTAKVSSTITTLQHSVWGMGAGLFILAVGLMFFIAKSPAQQLEQLAHTMGVSTQKDLSLAYQEILQKAEKYQEERILMAENIAVGQIASQVAHDIRSPLTALKVVSTHLSEVPEEKRLMIRNAVQRIDDIANDLAERKQQPTTTATTDDAKEPASVQLLSSLIEPLISEKRTQHRSQFGVHIQSTLDAHSYGLFAIVQPIAFNRILSNLVNNAVEALEGSGNVTIAMAQDAGQVVIRVMDTGQGIPPDILPKLMQRGATFGKATGSGLGLYHARTSVESWGGRSTLESEVGTGTTAVLTLPQANAPAWFVPQVHVSVNGTIVIIDDDTSIHQVWDERFATIDTAVHGITLQHFSSGSDVRAAYTDDPKTLYLCDYELLGEPHNGLDLIEQLGIQRQSILVTSRYEEADVQQRCATMGVRLIPKGLAGYVPITVESVVLEGNEALMRDSASQKPIA